MKYLMIKTIKSLSVGSFLPLSMPLYVITGLIIFGKVFFYSCLVGFC